MGRSPSSNSNPTDDRERHHREESDGARQTATGEFWSLPDPSSAYVEPPWNIHWASCPASETSPGLKRWDRTEGGKTIPEPVLRNPPSSLIFPFLTTCLTQCELEQCRGARPDLPEKTLRAGPADAACEWDLRAAEGLDGGDDAAVKQQRTGYRRTWKGALKDRKRRENEMGFVLMRRRRTEATTFNRARTGAFWNLHWWQQVCRWSLPHAPFQNGATHDASGANDLAAFCSNTAGGFRVPSPLFVAMEVRGPLTIKCHERRKLAVVQSIKNTGRATSLNEIPSFRSFSPSADLSPAKDDPVKVLWNLFQADSKSQGRIPSAKSAKDDGHPEHPEHISNDPPPVVDSYERHIPGGGVRAHFADLTPLSLKSFGCGFIGPLNQPTTPPSTGPRPTLMNIDKATSIVNPDGFRGAIDRARWAVPTLRLLLALTEIDHRFKKLDYDGGNWFLWVEDVKIFLKHKGPNIRNAIEAKVTDEEPEKVPDDQPLTVTNKKAEERVARQSPRAQGAASAMYYLQGCIDEQLKEECRPIYRTPFSLFHALQHRFRGQAALLKPRATNEWNNLRYVDHFTNANAYAVGPLRGQSK
ncbi:hypothetical protein BDK51DRAFT_50261 [Blyttiomyces helicus]|uniref:Uncharacterized protein n=1 Tax=Blyttiomyces helicus TaxID=388810 RepID=A0A4P9W9N8_9FUNG|nr:hypothetical protein BDK51DRAFT_50261 [Blyttiomyces helicus]|eukprot:RKO87848.1 hypothetical protein BDK51DRAFT_50261 [Blyttiomyces helicus]